jgi:hypothetical protein
MPPRSEAYLAKQRVYDRRRRKDPARRRANIRYDMRRKYGITPEIVEKTKKDQGGRCAICRIIPKTWHTDHCHKTKKFRAMLCASCNTFLGRIESDPQRVPKALKYLEKYK